MLFHNFFNYDPYIHFLQIFQDQVMMGNTEQRFLDSSEEHGGVPYESCVCPQVPVRWDISITSPMRHLEGWQIPKLPQMTPFNAEDQWLYSKPTDDELSRRGSGLYLFLRVMPDTLRRKLISATCKGQYTLLQLKIMTSELEVFILTLFFKLDCFNNNFHEFLLHVQYCVGFPCNCRIFA